MILEPSTAPDRREVEEEHGLGRHRRLGAAIEYEAEERRPGAVVADHEERCVAVAMPSRLRAELLGPAPALDGRIDEAAPARLLPGTDDEARQVARVARLHHLADVERQSADQGPPERCLVCSVCGMFLR